jgi:4-hydroxy-3-polyprenylbenzoate decarboxylase
MKIVIAMTGASGAIYPQRLVAELSRSEHQLYFVASRNAHAVCQTELNMALEDISPHVYRPDDFNVPFVSGSARLDAMVIVPCSMGTLGRIANGISADSITRAADVFLKERRKLIIVPREMPYSSIHLQNMLQLSQAGAMILPASPSFYGGQKTLTDVADTVVARILDHLGISHDLIRRWHEK